MNKIPISPFDDDEACTYTFVDEIQCGDTGFIIQEGEIDLVIDNVFAYRVDARATPTP